MSSITHLNMCLSLQMCVILQSVALVAKSEILKHLCGLDPRAPASTGTSSVVAGLGSGGVWVVRHIPAKCLNADFTRGAALTRWGRETPPMNC